MARIRVCQLITELRPAGAERCVYELATRLDRDRFDVSVAALSGGAVADWLSRVGVSVRVLGPPGKLAVAMKLPALARYLRQERIDLVHTHLFHADLAGRLAARLAGVRRLVHTVHIAERRYLPWRFAWARLAAGWCDRIVCVSQAVRDQHAAKAHLPLTRYQVIYNGIDLERMRADPQRRRMLRRAWSVGDGDILLAYVGRLDPQKNIGMLLDSAAEARRRDGRIRLVIAGDGPLRAQVEQFCNAPGAKDWVRCLGFTDDVPGVLSAADMLVMPSRWEGFGLAAAEAMAAGLPVAATRVAGLSEVVEHEKTGLLVESDDRPGFVAAILRLARDERLRLNLGQAGLARVRERFSIGQFIHAHEELYGSVINHAPPRKP